MDLRNSMEWIFPESMDLPDIFQSMEIYNYYEKSKSILITPPARRAWRSLKFAPFLFFFVNVESWATADG